MYLPLPAQNQSFYIHCNSLLNFVLADPHFNFWGQLSRTSHDIECLNRPAYTCRRSRIYAQGKSLVSILVRPLRKAGQCFTSKIVCDMVSLSVMIKIHYVTI